MRAVALVAGPFMALCQRLCTRFCAASSDRQVGQRGAGAAGAEAAAYRAGRVDHTLSYTLFTTPPPPPDPGQVWRGGRRHRRPGSPPGGQCRPPHGPPGAAAPAVGGGCLGGRMRSLTPNNTPPAAPPPCPHKSANACMSPPPPRVCRWMTSCGCTSPSARRARGSWSCGAGAVARMAAACMAVPSCSHTGSPPSGR